ncbi:MAG TPA: protoporphyrinogen oxidase, partial [Vicinamibacterales bacterium]|nr:protoporphyrinogen oxidase [Vicinamibacterales bacterium]
NIRTARMDGYTCESGPDGFLDNAPETLQLVRALDLESRLLPSNDAARRRYVFLDGALREVPTSPRDFLGTSLLSVPGKLRVACEPFARQSRETDESIYEFAARRIGREAASVLVDSMVSGIFAGDSRRLSLRACFPKMHQLEEQHGGLFRALLATRKQRRKGDAVGAPAGRLTSFTSGMGDLVDRLTRTLGDVVRTSSPVASLRHAARFDGHRAGWPATGYTVTTDQDELAADVVILAGPSADSAQLLRTFDPDLASALGEIPSAPLSVVCLGYDAARVAQCCSLNGFGFLVPRGQNIRILGALWESSIYRNRAPAGKALLRVMIGGACDTEAVALSDDALVSAVREDLIRTMGLTCAPEFTSIIRHRRGIPQYVKGHLPRLQRIDAMLQPHPGLFVAGSSYRGASLNACVSEAAQIAERVVRQSAESSAA